ncbi:MAG: hypothetical protein ACRDD8_08395 [Bacteroidales bacterium]
MRYIALLFIFILLQSCSDDEFHAESEQPIRFGNLELHVKSIDPNLSAVPIINQTRIFAFHATTKNFNYELLNVNYENEGFNSLIKTGSWRLALLSAPDKNIWLPAYSNKTYDNLAMYEYQPTQDVNGSASAPEIFTAFADVDNVTEGQAVQASAVMSRNVAKVEIAIKKLFGEIDLDATENRVFLLNVPNKISYAGNLLPDAHNPDTLSTGIFAPLKLRREGGGLLCEDVSFIIPGNKDDISGINEISHKMKLAIQLRRMDGSIYYKQREINLSAKCNEILRVNLTVNALTIDLETSVHPWLVVPVKPEI